MAEGMPVLSVGDKWSLHSIDTISYLQNRLEEYESWVVQASVLGDNREVFTFIFPVCVGLWNELGARVLWAAILVEWSNLLLKWTFKGERPYWWIGETDLYSDATRPKLRQFPNTCESGPGTPSGHLMMNVAVFYVIAKGLCCRFIWPSKKLSSCMKWLIASIVFFSYVVWISCISLSRLYIQAHFLHQCILGLAAGLVVGHFSWRNTWLVRMSTMKAVFFSSVLILSTASIYSLLLLNGLDPLWTIPLAMKYCIKAEFVRVDTQAFYIMTRFTAAALGLGLGLASIQWRAASSAPSHFLRTVLVIKGGLLLGKTAAFIQSILPTDDMVIYLSLNFVLNVLSSYTIIALLPYFLFTIFPGN